MFVYVDHRSAWTGTWGSPRKVPELLPQDGMTTARLSTPFGGRSTMLGTFPKGAAVDLADLPSVGNDLLDIVNSRSSKLWNGSGSGHSASLGTLNSEIHVWWMNLDQGRDYVEQCFTILGEEDRARINQYKTVRLRERHGVSRGTLLRLLALYMNEDVDSVELATNQFGKPFLAGQKGKSGLQFNVSHSARARRFRLYQVSTRGR